MPITHLLYQHYNIACAPYTHALHCAHNLSIERTSMSFVALPASCAWLQTADYNFVTHEHFVQCCQDYCEWLRASGVPENQIHTWVNGFVFPGDLQTYANVVSWWPKNAPASYAPPTLFTIMQDLRLQPDGPQTKFVESLDWYVERVKEWIRVQRMSMDNPNEDKEERERRLNRERVARHRIKHMPGSDDPEEQALISEAKAAQDSLSEGRKWIKSYERETIALMKVEIAECKKRQAQKVMDAQSHIAQAERRVEAARAALDSYRFNK